MGDEATDCKWYRSSGCHLNWIPWHWYASKEKVKAFAVREGLCDKTCPMFERAVDGIDLPSFVDKCR